MTPEEIAKRDWHPGQWSEQKLLERFERLTGIYVGGEIRFKPSLVRIVINNPESPDKPDGPVERNLKIVSGI